MSCLLCFFLGQLTHPVCPVCWPFLFPFTVIIGVWALTFVCRHESFDHHWYELARRGGGEKSELSGSGGLSMIGECRWVLQCFPYRHWISSPPLKAAAAASPGTSCTEPQFSRESVVRQRQRETQWGTVLVYFFISFLYILFNWALLNLKLVNISLLKV